MEIKLFTYRSKRVTRFYDICNTASLGSVNEIGVGLPVSDSSEPIFFRNRHDYLIASGNPEKMNEFLGEAKLNSTLSGIYIYFFGAGYTQGTSELTTHSLVGQNTAITVDIQGHYMAYNSRRRPCNQQLNEASKCRHNCKIQAIYDLCNCWPLTTVTFASLTPLGPFCGDRMGPPQNSSPYYIPDYHECLSYREFGTVDPARNCIENCMKEDCEYFKLTFISELYPFPCSENISTCQMVSFRHFTFPLIEEVLAKSFGTFIAEFGGLLGFWLGGSVIAFSHLFLFLLASMCDLKVKNCADDKASVNINCDIQRQELSSPL